MRISRLLTSLLTALAVALTTLALAGPAFAQECSCDDLEASSREDAEVVFTGETTGEPTQVDGQLVWTFAVERVEEGDVGDVVDVATAASDDECGYAFESGARYRVYAVEYEGGAAAAYETNTCLGTVKVLTAGGAAQQPTEEPTEEATAAVATPSPAATVEAPEDLSDTGAPLVLLASAGLASITAGALLHHRRR